VIRINARPDRLAYRVRQSLDGRYQNPTRVFEWVVLMPRLSEGQYVFLEAQVWSELERLAERVCAASQARDLTDIYSSACEILALIDHVREPAAAPHAPKGPGSHTLDGD
jgi:hypothetical protein